MARLLSLAAGVQIDVAPADMVTVAHDAGWPAVGIWFDGKTWTDTTSRDVRQRLDDTGVVALDIEPIIPSQDGNDFAEQLIEAAAVIGARHILFTSRLKDQARTTDRYQQVCEMALPHGIKVVCEFLPIFPLNTLSKAAEIVANSRATNGGVLIDNLHLSRSGSSIVAPGGGRTARHLRLAARSRGRTGANVHRPPPAGWCRPAVQPPAHGTRP